VIQVLPSAKPMYYLPQRQALVGVRAVTTVGRMEHTAAASQVVPTIVGREPGVAAALPPRQELMEQRTQLGQTEWSTPELHRCSGIEIELDDRETDACQVGDRGIV
jgi:hypothetical protein